MRRLHKCYAKASIYWAAGDHYLSPANENSLKTLRKRTKMNLIRNFRNWRRYRETVNELSRLSTRELNDLGITRAEIHGIARGGAR
jgi:uncharacterized protein YjiS (DUF1127 family)